MADPKDLNEAEWFRLKMLMYGRCNYLGRFRACDTRHQCMDVLRDLRKSQDADPERRGGEYDPASNSWTKPCGHLRLEHVEAMIGRLPDDRGTTPGWVPEEYLTAKTTGPLHNRLLAYVAGRNHGEDAGKREACPYVKGPLKAAWMAGFDSTPRLVKIRKLDRAV